MPEIISRKDALAQGLKRYFTGAPCKRGHICLRTVSNSTCHACGRTSKTIAYAKNPDTVKQREKRYRDNNPEKVSKERKAYRERNLEACMERQRNYRKSNRAAVSASRQNRRCREKSAEGKFCAEDIAAILKRQKYLCGEPNCKKDITGAYQIDHIMPLALGGSNWPSNLQCLCAYCNGSKNAKHPLRWAAENGRLV